MKKKFLIYLIFSLIILISAGSKVALASNIIAAPDGLIVSHPKKGFLSASNLAPGDSVTSKLSVKNGRDTVIDYRISASKVKGDDLLYNILNIEIKGEKGEVIYKGKLKDLNDITVGKLAVQQEDSFDFILSFPYTAGKEYQHLSLTNKFTISAQEESGNVNADINNGDEKNTGTLPITGTNIFWIIPVGMVVTVLGVSLLRYNKAK